MTTAALSVIVTNAKIRTGDPARPWTTAFGLKDGKLAVIGSAAEILKMANAECRIIDAHGTVLTLPSGLKLGSAVEVTVADGTVTLSEALG